MAEEFVLDLYICLIFGTVSISRFWMQFIIIDEKNIFLGPQGPTGTLYKYHVLICDHPLPGPFRGMFWMIRFSTFSTKTHFPENQKC